MNEVKRLKGHLVDANEDLSEIYEAVFGIDGIDRYTHGELIEMLNEMYDCYKHVVESVYNKGETI
jgi:hypothetical protein